MATSLAIVDGDLQSFLGRSREENGHDWHCRKIRIHIVPMGKDVVGISDTRRHHKHKRGDFVYGIVMPF